MPIQKETGEKRGNANPDFTPLTFDEIKQKLVNRAKNYYPDTYQDFSRTSFGSMMIDMVSLIGEQLNFYANFVAAETLSPETALTETSLAYHARKTGTDVFNSITSTGVVKFYTLIPIGITGPDNKYKHRILKGAVLTTPNGGVFTTTEDVVIDMNTDNIVGTTFSDDGARVSYYIYESEAPVISGEERTISVTVGTYQKFLKVEIKDFSVSEIIKVVDLNGNEYFQVDNLSQNVVYKPMPNREANDSNAPERLIPFPVPRRFTVESMNNRNFLVFGFGSEDNLKTKSVANPSDIALKVTGKNYVSDNVFDPTKLLSTDKFGVAPQNTVLNITYRSNTTDNSNAPVGSISDVSSAEIVFENENTLEEAKLNFIKENINATNLEPINGTLKFTTTQEVSQMIKSSMGAQGRAVTLNDYVAASYNMPSKFGSVTRASVSRDENDLKRNLNMYVISSDRDGNLQQASTSLKNNLKTWLNSVRMVTDTIEIYDAKIINIGIELDLVISEKTNFSTALSEIRNKLFEDLTITKSQIGQAFSIGEVEKILSSIPNIVRFNGIKIVSKSGKGYSDIRYDIATNVSPDGGLIYIPEDSIWEIKNASDITGKVQ